MPAHALTGAEALEPCLAIAGVRVVFCGPEDALPVTAPAVAPEPRVRQVRAVHAQGAGHAAQGYATATGEVGVCVVTTASAFASAITPLADAHLDSVPLLLVVAGSRGSDGMRLSEVDVFGATLAICKHSIVVDDPAAVPGAVLEAVGLAATGRPGAVVLHLTDSALRGAAAEAEDLPSPPEPVAPTRPDLGAVHRAARLLRDAERPVVYAGGGVIKAEAGPVVRRLCELEQVPVVTTLMARGCVPDSHPLTLGMPGMHGTVAAVGALQRADLILAVGARFDDRVTGDLSSFAPGARVVHLDVDPAEISKNRRADVALIGDARVGLELLLTELDGLTGLVPHARSAWLDRVNGWRETYRVRQSGGGDVLTPQTVISRISEIAGTEATYTAGVGQHQMWSAHFIRFERSRQWLNSGGAGTMGYAVPAALGAGIGTPGRTVWAIDGDGCFQMTNRELLACVREKVPVKVAVINNSSLGMIRQWQTLVYDGRYSQSDLQTGSTARDSRPIPDFVRLAEALGCVGLRCARESDLDGVIAAAMAVEDRPVVVDFVVAPDAMVWPMVQAGASNDSIQVALDLAPQWDAEVL